MTERERTRVGHTLTDETDVYVGRGPDAKAMGDVPIGEKGWLGNPYTVKEYGREESIERFRVDFTQRIATDGEFRDAVEDLAGKTLGCWCQTLEDDDPACHAEVIAEWADMLAESESTEAFSAADGRYRIECLECGATEYGDPDDDPQWDKRYHRGHHCPDAEFHLRPLPAKAAAEVESDV